MPGFYVSNICNDVNLFNYIQKGCLQRNLCIPGFIVKSNTLNKFTDDKVFTQDERYIYIIDGFLLNKDDLLKKYGSGNLQDLIKKLASQGESAFFSEFRGSFSGALYDKVSGKWCFFTNHMGDQPLFYYFHQKLFIVASQFNYITDALRQNGQPITLNENAAFNMLTYGYMPDNNTFVREIRRLEPGSYLNVSEDGITECNYYKVRNSAWDLTGKTKNKIIDELDVLFCKAVAMEYDKDLEYGYRHLTDLSGGLDSRMVTYVAKSLGYKDILNISYGHTGCRDQRVSQEIAANLGTSYLFRSLDDLSFFYDIDDTVQMNYGLTIYTMTTGSKGLIEVLDGDKFGIAHTGLIGDSVVGTYSYRSDIYPETDRSIMYSFRLEDRVGYTRRYDSFDTECLNKRGIRGIMTAMLIRKHYMEASSPFANVELLDYCLSIPLEMRRSHGIYLDWIRNCYPDAADIVWDKTGIKPNAPIYVKSLAKVKRHWQKNIAQILNRKGETHCCQDAMSPFAFWYGNNVVLRTFMSDYFARYIGYPVISDRLRMDLVTLYTTGTIQEKLQVLTVLSAIKTFFKEEG